MKRKLLILAFSFLFLCNSFAQDGRFMGMGNASIVLDGLWALNNNQAGISNIQHPSFGILYANRFNIREIGYQGAAAVVPTRSGNFGLNYNRYGFELYAENTLGLAYARSLGEYISIGLQIDYLFYTQNEYYGYKGTIVGEIGFIAKPGKNFRLGAHLYNPTQNTLEDYNNQNIPTTMRFGMAYYFHEPIVLSVEVEKGINRKVQFKSGVEYNLIKTFFIRTGFSTAPNSFSLGMGYALPSWAFNIAFATHESLPLSAYVSLKYELNKKN